MSAPANDAQHGLFEEIPDQALKVNSQRAIPPNTSPLRPRRLVAEVSADSDDDDGPGTFATVVRDPETGRVLGHDHGLADGGDPPAAAGAMVGLALARAVDPAAEIELRLVDRDVVEGLAAENTAPQVIWTWVARGDNRRADQLLRVTLAEDNAPRTL